MMQFKGMPSEPQGLSLSAEFFPPKSEKAAVRLRKSAEALSTYGLEFCSVTYGAGGTTRDGTLEAALAVANGAESEAAAHLTVVGSSREEVDAVARAFQEAGVRRIVALRGDPQDGETQYRPHPDGYANAAELVAGLRALGDFDISVAAYPEVHPDSESRDADLDNLKAKFEAGADRAITQFFFDPDVFLRFRDAAARRGIWHPLVPGILPIRNIKQVVDFAGRCGAAVPASVVEAFEGADDPEARKERAIEQAHRMCERLLRHGVRAFHFYTLNHDDLTAAVCDRLTGSEAVDRAVAATALLGSEQTR